MLSVLLSAAGMLLTVWSHSMAWLVASRVLTGLGVGGILPCTNVLVSEYANKKWHGLAIAVYASGFGVGAMVGGMSAVMLQTQYGWRSVFMVGAVLTAMAFVALVALLPESVDYLLNRRPADAKARLNAIAAKMGAARRLGVPRGEASRARRVGVALVPSRLFENHAADLAGVYRGDGGVLLYQLVDAHAAGRGGHEQGEQPNGGHGDFHWRGGGVAAVRFLVSRWSARTMLLAFAGLAAAAVCAFVPATANLSLALVLAVVLGALSNGCIAGLYTINPALWEADFRSTGVAVAIGVGRIGSMVSPVLVGMLLDNGWQKNQLYFGAAAVLLLAMAAVTGLKQRV